jgi:hypothetical protein
MLHPKQDTSLKPVLEVRVCVCAGLNSYSFFNFLPCFLFAIASLSLHLQHVQCLFVAPSLIFLIWPSDYICLLKQAQDFNLADARYASQPGIRRAMLHGLVDLAAQAPGKSKHWKGIDHRCRVGISTVTVSARSRESLDCSVVCFGVMLMEKMNDFGIWF